MPQHLYRRSQSSLGAFWYFSYNSDVTLTEEIAECDTEGQLEETMLRNDMFELMMQGR